MCLSITIHDNQIYSAEGKRVYLHIWEVGPIHYTPPPPGHYCMLSYCRLHLYNILASFLNISHWSWTLVTHHRSMCHTFKFKFAPAASPSLILQLLDPGYMGLDNLASSVFKCNYRKGNHECNFTQINFPLISNEMVTQQFFFCSWSFWHAKSHFYWGTAVVLFEQRSKAADVFHILGSLVVPGITCLNDCICKQWEMLVQWPPAQYFGFSWLQSCTELTKSCCNRATSCFPFSLSHSSHILGRFHFCFHSSMFVLIFLDGMFKKICITRTSHRFWKICCCLVSLFFLLFSVFKN